MKKFTVTHILAISVFAVITAFLAMYSSRFINTDYTHADSETESDAAQTAITESTIESGEEKEPSDSSIWKDNGDDASIGDNDSDIILPQTDDAGIGYIEQLIFITDNSLSSLKGFSLAGIPNPSYQTWSSDDENIDCTELALKNYFTYPATGERLTFEEAVKAAKPKFVILTFGSYCEGIFSDEDFKSSYSDFIKALKSASPNTNIIVQSILPVSSTCRVINNDEVIRRNKLLVEICEQNNVYYLDTHSVLSNEYGILLADYTGTAGYSLNESGCRKMAEYIRFHAHPAFGEK